MILQDQEGVLAWVSERLAVAMRQARLFGLYKPTLINLKARQGNKGQAMKEKDFTGLEDIETVECPFRFPKDLLTAYRPERLNETDHDAERRVICDSLNTANE